MSSIKSAFSVRKSNRLSLSRRRSDGKKEQNEVDESKTYEPKMCKDQKSPGSGKDSMLSAIKNAICTKEQKSRSNSGTDEESTQGARRSDHRSPVDKKSPGLLSPSTPKSPRSPAVVNALSFSKQNADALTAELTRACRRLLSPTKRKSDEGNENSCGSVSPVKSLRSSPEDFSPVKSNRSRLSISPKTSPRTPKSSIRSNTNTPRSLNATPRRLFSSPEKKNDSLNRIPSKLATDFLLTPADSPSVVPPSLKLHRANARPYQSAKRSLHTAKPVQLVGREKEEVELENFLCDRLDSGTSGSLYISGAPGTGKTAVVNHVLDKLKSEYEGIRTAFINCMMLKDSNSVFSQIHEQLKGTPLKVKDGLRAMERLFMTCKDNILLVLDEIDQLDSKHHHVLYHIFEWPAIPKSKLVLIGIANALDLTDRVLPRLQASKTCRPTLMNFPPYTSAQITDILRNRLERDVIVEPSAINFCARKISAVAGDMRKALDVCRRAVEMVESDVRCQQVLKPSDCNSPTKKNQPVPLKKVTIVHISKVMSEVYGSSVSAANSSENDVPLQQKLAVCSLLVMVKCGKLKEVQLGRLHEAYIKISRKQQMTPVDQSEFHSVLSLLDARGVIVLKKAKDTRMTKVSLKLDEQELEQTLKDKALMATILKNGIPK